MSDTVSPRYELCHEKTELAQIGFDFTTCFVNFLFLSSSEVQYLKFLETFCGCTVGLSQTHPPEDLFFTTRLI